ncbi:MAG: hypothetical protein HQM08_21270 [Candidatus Riflebacteria bacterium]|nr:hypothetical protein [Candidatus Riflebacteria bacterium]
MECNEAREKILLGSDDEALVRHVQTCLKCNNWLNSAIEKPFVEINEFRLDLPPSFDSLNLNFQSSFGIIDKIKAFFAMGLTFVIVFFIASNIGQNPNYRSIQNVQHENYSFFNVEEYLDQTHFSFVDSSEKSIINTEFRVPIEEENRFVDEVEWSFLDREPSKYSFIEEEKI